MKDLRVYMDNMRVSLNGLDADIVEKLKNIDGMQISECCGCCGCCDCGCEPCCCDTPVDPDPAFTMYFYSEKEIIDKLKTVVKVQDLFNLHTQFSANRFSLYPCCKDMPLLFTEKLLLPTGQLMQGKSFYNNKRLLELINQSQLSEVVVLVRLDNSIQIFGLKYTGTNGKEGSIKNSLIEVSKKLAELEKIDEVTWSQVLDVSIDNADDVYSFLITFTLDPNKIPDNPEIPGEIIPKANKNIPR